MLRVVRRALLLAGVAVSATACGAGMGDPADGSSAGSSSRYRILIPAMSVEGGASARAGESVSDNLRSLVSGMATHTSVPEKEYRSAMKKNNVEQLDPVTSRQLAQLIGAQLTAWGTVEQNGSGLEADVRFVDVRSGDEFTVDGATGADPKALAQNIFSGLEQKIEGIRQAVFCNDKISTQQYEEAIETCDAALAVVPGNTTALYSKATALYNLDRIPESLDIYDEVLRIDENNSNALLGAGLAASKSGQTQKATGYYLRYMELNPGDATVRMKVAGDIAATDDYVSAYEVLAPAASDNLDNLDYQQYLAQVATAAGQKVSTDADAATAIPYFETALAAYDRILGTRGDSLGADVYRQIVAVNLALDRTDQALSTAEMATQRFGDEAGVWSTYANVLNKADRSTDEARALDRALELDPQLENGYIRRALAHMDAGNRQGAVADFRRAAEGGNKEDVARALLSMASEPLKNEQWSQAENLLSASREYAEGDTRSQVNFFLGYLKLKQADGIARGNTEGRAAPARRALGLLREAATFLQASNHASAANTLSQTQQYIANQEAIVKAAG